MPDRAFDDPAPKGEDVIVDFVSWLLAASGLPEVKAKGGVPDLKLHDMEAKRMVRDRPQTECAT